MLTTHLLEKYTLNHYLEETTMKTSKTLVCLGTASTSTLGWPSKKTEGLKANCTFDGSKHSSLLSCKK